MPGSVHHADESRSGASDWAVARVLRVRGHYAARTGERLSRSTLYQDGHRRLRGRSVQGRGFLSGTETDRGRGAPPFLVEGRGPGAQRLQPSDALLSTCRTCHRRILSAARLTSAPWPRSSARTSWARPRLST